MKNEKEEKPEKEREAHVVVRNATDYQRMKLEKLMKNPEKPVLIPERPKERGSPHVPDFVRNVMGSSAGAGSGEFHVYRHLRRKEYARQKYMSEKAMKEQQDEEYRDKLEENKRLAEERTAKKRAKRLKKNKKQKKNGKKTKISKESSSEKSEDSGDESGNNENSQEAEENLKIIESNTTDNDNKPKLGSQMGVGVSQQNLTDETNVIMDCDNDKDEKMMVNDVKNDLNEITTNTKKSNETSES